jgi:hypothetical protein
MDSHLLSCIMVDAIFCFQYSKAFKLQMKRLFFLTWKILVVWLQFGACTTVSCILWQSPFICMGVSTLTLCWITASFIYFFPYIILLYVLYCIISFYWFSDSEDVSRSKKPEKLDNEFFIRLQTSVGVGIRNCTKPMLVIRVVLRAHNHGSHNNQRNGSDM